MLYLCIWMFHSQSRSMSMSMSMSMSKFASPCARSIHVHLHYVPVHARILDAKKPKKCARRGRSGLLYLKLTKLRRECRASLQFPISRQLDPVRDAKTRLTRISTFLCTPSCSNNLNKSSTVLIMIIMDPSYHRGCGGWEATCLSTCLAAV